MTPETVLAASLTIGMGLVGWIITIEQRIGRLEGKLDGIAEDVKWIVQHILDKEKRRA